MVKKFECVQKIFLNQQMEQAIPFFDNSVDVAIVVVGIIVVTVVVTVVTVVITVVTAVVIVVTAVVVSMDVFAFEQN